jgi:hypothetical protein
MKKLTLVKEKCDKQGGVQDAMMIIARYGMKEMRFGGGNSG